MLLPISLLSSSSSLVLSSLLPNLLCYLLQLVIHFDGSLRPPHDPGFPKLPVPMASCAATIHLVDDDDVQDDHDDTTTETTAAFIDAADVTTATKRSNNNNKVLLVMMGAKEIQVIPGITTSAHVEYEGLLLGLDLLCRQLQSSHSWIWDHTLSSNPTIINITSIIIRGDCKTVLDQLHHPHPSQQPQQWQHPQQQSHQHDMGIVTTSGIPISRARIMEPYYRRAMSYLEQLLLLIVSLSSKNRIRNNVPRNIERSNNNNDDDDDLQLLPPPPQLIIQHTPRVQNTLCHTICEQVMEFLEEVAYNDVLNDAHAFFHRTRLSSSSSLSSSYSLSLSSSESKNKPPRIPSSHSSSSSLLSILQKHDLLWLESRQTNSLLYHPNGINDCGGCSSSRIRYSMRPSLYRYLAQQVLHQLLVVAATVSTTIDTSTTTTKTTYVGNNDDDDSLPAALEAIGRSLEITAKKMMNNNRNYTQQQKQQVLRMEEEGIQYQITALQQYLAASKSSTTATRNDDKNKKKEKVMKKKRRPSKREVDLALQKLQKQLDNLLRRKHHQQQQQQNHPRNSTHFAETLLLHSQQEKTDSTTTPATTIMGLTPSLTLHHFGLAFITDRQQQEEFIPENDHTRTIAGINNNDNNLDNDVMALAKWRSFLFQSIDNDSSGDDVHNDKSNEYNEMAHWQLAINSQQHCPQRIQRRKHQLEKLRSETGLWVKL